MKCSGRPAYWHELGKIKKNTAAADCQPLERIKMCVRFLICVIIFVNCTLNSRKSELVRFYTKASAEKCSLPFFELELKNDFKFIATNNLSGIFYFYNQGSWDVKHDTLILYEKKYFRINGFTDKEKEIIGKTALQTKGICVSNIPEVYHSNIDSTINYKMIIKNNILKELSSDCYFKRR